MWLPETIPRVLSGYLAAVSALDIDRPLLLGTLGNSLSTDVSVLCNFFAFVPREIHNLLITNVCHHVRLGWSVDHCPWNSLYNYSREPTTRRTPSGRSKSTLICEDRIRNQVPCHKADILSIIGSSHIIHFFFLENNDSYN